MQGTVDLLAGAAFTIEAARRQIDDQPAAADALLERADEAVRAAVQNLRTL